jgi:hypothetical protein
MYLLECGIGLNPDAVRNELTWHLPGKFRAGCQNYFVRPAKNVATNESKEGKTTVFDPIEVQEYPLNGRQAYMEDPATLLLTIPSLGCIAVLR